jgi:probable rRNA maturation factor
MTPSVMPSRAVADGSLTLDVQVACEGVDLPSEIDFRRWAKAALAGAAVDAAAEITLRIVDEAEGAALNQRYRKKAGPTNVLAFPYDVETEQDLHGDLVMCAPVVQREAREQGKTAAAHWAHMCVHGILHLCGYDHATQDEADVMEGLETSILVGLGFPRPYE